MAKFLTNYSLASPLKHQLPARNRCNNSPTTPSKRANRLPVLPELSGEHDVSFPSPSTASSTSSTSSTPSRSTCPKVKRLTRYGRDEFGAFSLTDDFLSAVPRAAPQPPASSPASSSPSTKSMHRSVRLSSFDIVIDICASEPSSPVSEIPAAPCTPPRSRDLRRLSPPRSRSPTPSLTSMSACSSTEMPLTPGASDDESYGLRVPSKKAASPRPRISKHPLMIKSTSPLSASDAHSEDSFEFTLGPFSPLSGLEADQIEAVDEEEEDALWYSRELSQLVSLPSPQDSSNGRARPDSLLPMPRGASSCTDQPSAYSQIDKALPAISRTSVPNPQLDPTFPEVMTLPPSVTLRPSDHPSEPLSPLALPSPVAPHKPESTSHRKSLTITVPRTLLPNKITVSDILDDINAWSLGTPSAITSSSTQILSPPRVPHSPALSQFSEYDPVEFIVSYATRPASPAPAPSLSETACKEMPATFLDLEDDDEEDKIHSRWSCSTLATLAPPATSSPPSPTFAAASARLRLHLASVARRVRIRRAGRSSSSSSSNSSGERTASIHSSEGSLHVRSSSELNKLRFGL